MDTSLKRKNFLFIKEENGYFSIYLDLELFPQVQLIGGFAFMSPVT